MPKLRYAGFDLSLNHGAGVLIDAQGRLRDFAYYTNLKGISQKSKRGSLVPPEISKIKEAHQRQMERLVWFEAWFNCVLASWRPSYAGVEDYAMGATNQAYHIGEVGGVARIACWRAGISLRLHDPTTIKMYATHNGTADKPMMEAAATERWGANFDIVVSQQPGKKANRESSEDLSDATAIAQLVLLEHRLRLGLETLAGLPHDKERQVFNRVTKSYPVSLLGREWLLDPARAK